MADAGDRFPDFELKAQNGRMWSLSDLSGERAVLYFFPRADTSG